MLGFDGDFQGMELILRRVEATTEQNGFLTHKAIRSYARCLLRLLPEIILSKEAETEVKTLLAALSAPGLAIYDRSFLATRILKRLEDERARTESKSQSTGDFFLMFKKIQIPLRTFYCELKHRPPDDTDGSREELIETLELQVPKLKNSDLEKQWCFAQLWNKLFEPEYQNRGINQVFIFTAEAGELLMRLEVNQFSDEPSRKIPPPDPTVFETWQQKVEQKFKRLYGISIKQWQQQSL